MELKEAILHATDKAKGTTKCNQEHMQLVAWLIELQELREYKIKHDKQLLKLIKAPIYRKCIDQTPIHGVGCKLNFV